MNINEVAKLTELSPRQIREYEKLGLLQTIQRTDSGYRVFSDTQLQRLKFIKHARDVGFSLAQIEALLALQDNKQRSNAQVKALTRNHIDELSDKIQRLQSMKTTLQGWHDSCLGDVITFISINVYIFKNKFTSSDFFTHFNWIICFFIVEF